MVINTRSLKDGIWWIGSALVALIAAAFIYFRYGIDPLSGPSGGSIVGLVLGGAGFAMISFCMLLNLRKFLRSFRLGSLYGWMQGHVWVGLLSYPIILFHAGFHWGGPLTCTLMWIFTIVEISGITGLVFQTLLPKQMQEGLPRETIYREIAELRRQNLNRGEELLAMCAASFESGEASQASSGGVATVATLTPATELSDFYRKTVEPYLRARPPAGRVDQTLRSAFDDFRRDTLSQYPRSADKLRPFLIELEALVHEQNNFTRQSRLHLLLHAWLLLHVPLSYGLYLLAIAHAVMAIRY